MYDSQNCNLATVLIAFFSLKTLFNLYNYPRGDPILKVSGWSRSVLELWQSKTVLNSPTTFCQLPTHTSYMKLTDLHCPWLSSVLKTHNFELMGNQFYPNNQCCFFQAKFVQPCLHLNLQTIPKKIGAALYHRTTQLPTG